MRREQWYVLRLWNDGSSPRDWRIALAPLRGGPERYFGSLADLSRFLSEGSGLPPHDGPGPPPSPESGA